MILNVFQFFTNISNLSNESQLLGLTNYQNVLEHPLLQGMFKNIVILLWPLLDFPLPAPQCNSLPPSGCHLVYFIKVRP